MGRFINADNYPTTGQGLIGNNMFTYCGNNPIVRKDEKGTFWLVSVGIGLLTQYAGDVIGNIIDGKSGLDVFVPTSTVGEYIAAGVTALIPGSGVGSSLVKNIVTEGIKYTEKAIKGEQTSVLDSALSVVSNTVLDIGFGKISNKIVKSIDANISPNYSTHAHKVRQICPQATRDQIYQSLRHSMKLYHFASKASEFSVDVIRTVIDP